MAKTQKNAKKTRNKEKIKNNEMCSGGLLCFLFLIFLISNILPQLEPSSFNRRHRHHFPDHLLHHHLLLLLNQHHPDERTTQEEQRIRTPLSRGLGSQKGLRPLQPNTVILPGVSRLVVRFPIYQGICQHSSHLRTYVRIFIYQKILGEFRSPWTLNRDGRRK